VTISRFLGQKYSQVTLCYDEPLSFNGLPGALIERTS